MSEFLDLSQFKRPTSPNSWFVAPAAFATTAKVDDEAPVFPHPPQAIFDRIVKMLLGHDEWFLEVADEKTLQIRFVAVTRVLKFKDDVDLIVLPVEGQPDASTIAIYSRSRIGLTDLGVNRKRVTSFLAALSMP